MIALEQVSNRTEIGLESDVIPDWLCRNGVGQARSRGNGPVAIPFLSRGSAMNHSVGRAVWPVFAAGLLAFLLLACTIPAPEAPAPAVEPVSPDLPAAAGFGADPAVPRTVDSQALDERLPFNTRGWRTDFTKRVIDYAEIRSGGPPKDGIPALDAPTYESMEDAATWLTDTSPVIVYETEGVARAYPLAILMWHEIVNDEVAGRPVTVTFCPLCNASIVFDRRVGEDILDFGTTGNLRNSDLVMYDRQTESWWQQFTGQAIAGAYSTTQLNFLASQVLPFREFRNLFPDGDVLARPLDLYSRSYGFNPYVNYDTYGSGLSRGGDLVLFSGEPDDRLPPLDRVVGILFPDNSSVAIPFDVVSAAGVIQYTRDESDPGFVVFHQFGMSSALSEQDIGNARDIGSVGVFERQLADQVLDFEAAGEGLFADRQTGSTWNIRGQAVSGPLAGQALTPRIAFDHFWFAWAAFLPDTVLYRPQ